jgi:hypothetical protein
VKDPLPQAVYRSSPLGDKLWKELNEKHQGTEEKLKKEKKISEKNYD